MFSFFIRILTVLFHLISTFDVRLNELTISHLVHLIRCTNCIEHTLNIPSLLIGSKNNGHSMFSEINRSNHYYFRDFTLTISFSFNPFRVQYSSFLPTSVLNKSFLNKLNETKQWELRHFDRIKFQFHFNC